LIIYQWFMTRFLSSTLSVVRYEDVVSSNGAALDQALGWQGIERDSLSAKERKFDKQTLLTLEHAIPKLLALDCGDLYKQADIRLALKAKGL
jgi:hypothetical protein